MTIQKFADRLNSLDCPCVIDGSNLNIKTEDSEVYVSIDEDWEKSIKGFYRARQYKFNEESRHLTANRFVEYQIVRLHQSYSLRPEYEFQNKNEDVVVIGTATNEFILSWYNSKLYEDSFDVIINRIKRHYNRFTTKKRKRNTPPRMSLEKLLLIPLTVRFHPKRIIKKEDLEKRAKDRVKACLFNLAFSKNECWEVKGDFKTKPFSYSEPDDLVDELLIPSVNYSEDLVSYYKVAKSSLFPGQAFLSYYHILEYHFLMVNDERLYNSVKIQLNKPNFKATYKNVNKIFSTIKKYDTRNNETEMLKSVLNKYVSENEFINFIIDLEKDIGEKTYTKPKEEIFGKKINLKLTPTHALSNASTIIKHIRNSLVHSSNKHTREECLLPLSESESIVVRYIPLIKFLAEKIIFATAT